MVTTLCCPGMKIAAPHNLINYLFLVKIQILETNKIYFEQTTTRKMIAVTGKNLPYQLFDGFLLAKICKEYYCV